MATNRQAAAKSSGAERARKTLGDLIKRASRHRYVDPLREYDACDAEAQRNLFRDLWQAFEPLLQLPAADRRLPTCDRIRRYDEMSHSSEIDSFVDAYEVKEGFQLEWANKDPDPKNELAYDSDSSTSVGWSSYDFYKVPGTSGFIADRSKRGCTPDSCLPHNLISSQLLLYRLITVFGMPPSSEENEVDGYKGIWTYTLHWMMDRRSKKSDNGKKSKLVFSDCKGSFTIHFFGSKKASKSALDMIEWLVSDNVPHTYDGVLAGNQA
ncbi:hypothetical protein EDB80DRAFT_867452 [Ilyonectria destructans]|nr:hypothetical protein EDB80DRAFT_867452 [Ilyonectria destructans]